MKKIEATLTTPEMAKIPIAKEVHAEMVVRLSQTENFEDLAGTCMGMVLALAVTFIQTNRTKDRAIQTAMMFATDLVELVNVNYDTVHGTIAAEREMDRVFKDR